MSSVNFELVTELQHLLRRDFTVANKDLVKPSYSNPLMDGEFMNLDTAYKVGWESVARGSPANAARLRALLDPQ